ncbi:MAG: hypothetical protein ACJA2D_002767 [Pseudohongiellaceae bacterium]|jgi:hypothetical protein
MMLSKEIPLFRFMIVLFVSMLSFSLRLPTSFADTEFKDSVPLELAKAFLTNLPYGEAKLYSDIAGSFPDITIPAGFEFLGSIERGYGVSAALRTELPETERSALLIQSLLEAGFLELDSARGNGWQTGFVSST